MRWAWAIMALAALVGGSGCAVPVFVPHGQVMEVPRPGVPFEPKAIDLPPGQMTREQVLLTLGEPDFWWDGEKAFGYEWAVSRWTLMIVLLTWERMDGIEIPLSDWRRFVVRFDERGVVTSTAVIEKPFREYLAERRPQ